MSVFDIGFMQRRQTGGHEVMPERYVQVQYFLCPVGLGLKSRPIDAIVGCLAREYAARLGVSRHRDFQGGIVRDTEICRQLLELKEPWVVDRIKVDAQRRELHAYLRTGKSWFGRPAFVQPKSCWRHANVGPLKTYIHASLPEQGTESPEALPFLGPAGDDYTHGLAHKVIECLNAGLGYRQVCRLLDIDVYLAWQIRHAISEGVHGTDHGFEGALAESASPGAARQVIPPTGDPVWFNLLASDTPMDIRLLSLKLLLARSRQEFSGLTSHDAKILRVNTLRRFFIKHEKQLGHEIAQLATFRESAEGIDS